MAKRLAQNLNSAFIEAANRLGSRSARRKIVAYVESYDDVLFWSHLLHEVETEKTYFEVMLPSRTSLCKGKKIALYNDLGITLGKCMIACVDADYDFLMQGATETSAAVCTHPYVFHTYAYAIENFQCYAPSLHSVCVMATLNDRRLFDFEDFLRAFSEIIFPLFVWSVWCYRKGNYKTFSLADFFKTIELENLNYYHPEQTLESLRGRVNRRISRLQHQFPQARSSYKPLREELLGLGIKPEETYLYVRGHDLFDAIVVPMLTGVCDTLRREREREIRKLAEHATQMQNELAAYQHATASIAEMLRKQTGYVAAPVYQRIMDDLRNFVAKIEAEEALPAEHPAPALEPQAQERPPRNYYRRRGKR